MSGKSQMIWHFTVSQPVPDFCDGRRSFPTNENSNLYRWGRRRPSAMDFVAHYQSLKLLGSRPPVTNKHGVFLHEWYNRENLGQTSGDVSAVYRQNMGWSAKIKIMYVLTSQVNHIMLEYISRLLICPGNRLPLWLEISVLSSRDEEFMNFDTMHKTSIKLELAFLAAR